MAALKFKVSAAFGFVPVLGMLHFSDPWSWFGGFWAFSFARGTLGCD